jgi:transcription antitermination factor NusG
MSNYDDTSNMCWYAAYVRYRNEYKVAKLFEERLGLEVCVPSRKVWRKGRSDREFINKPLLETYVFFRANLEKLNLRSLFQVNGLLDLVRLAGKVAAVPDEEVESLKILAESDQPIHEVEYKKLKANQKIQVCEGPLKGAIGTFIKSDEYTGRLIVNVDIFQRSLEALVEAKFVKDF